MIYITPTNTKYKSFFLRYFLVHYAIFNTAMPEFYKYILPMAGIFRAYNSLSLRFSSSGSKTSWPEASRNPRKFRGFEIPLRPPRPPGKSKQTNVNKQM